MSKRLTAEQVAEYMHDLAKFHASQHNNRNAETWSEAEIVVRRSLVETDEQRRERFEAFCESHVPMPINPIRRLDGRYMDCVVQQWFEIFQVGATWHGETEGG